jgi:hypothetical protein
MAYLEKEKRLILAEASKQWYAPYLDAKQLDLAIKSTEELFSSFDHVIVPTFCTINLPRDNGHVGLDILSEVLPGLAFAHRHFGDRLPVDLQKKLTNLTQTGDTLFELMCLGFFERRHQVQYEPSLGNGKVPDLMLLLHGNTRVFIECKCQSVTESDSRSSFTRASALIREALFTKHPECIERAWEKGLRIEIDLLKCPSKNDAEQLPSALDQYSVDSLPVQCGKSITANLVDRAKPIENSKGVYSAIQSVGVTPTPLFGPNSVRLVVFPWKGLMNEHRKSQRALLRKARRKLRDIPESAFGLICIRTMWSRQFVDEDIHTLIRQEAYAKCPIVWHNPFGPGCSRLIWRNHAADLTEQIFGPLLDDSGNAKPA